VFPHPKQALIQQQQQQQQHSLLSQASWGRLEMKSKRDFKKTEYYLSYEAIVYRDAQAE
jgi:hypothetical protein